MSELILTRESEKYSRYGNISAEGIQKLLGTPNLDRLQTVIRETVQNSWDARREGCTPCYVVHLRELTSEQLSVFKTRVFQDLPSGDTNKSIEDFLSKDSHWVLEISDYGTTGLGGATDPSLVPEGESTDFVDFFRNIGTPRDTEKGGGTYGYGKSCLYGFSQCSTILVDTVTRYKRENVRRLMGCRINRRFDIKTGDEKGRYTGRHWWGVPEGDCLSPASGFIAHDLSIRIGLPERNESAYGTTIAILAPDINTEEPQKAVKAIEHALLWNFWPKMILDERTNHPSMLFQIWLNGERQALLDPDDCPPLNIFADAMRKLKSGNSKTILCLNPKKELGQLAIIKSPREDRLPEFGDGSETSFPKSIHHVALMRPAELVVKYLEGPPLPGRGEWGGVFICESDDEVESAFADSEPPAHDDWIPNNLPRGYKKTFVRVALRNIQREVDKIVGASRRRAESGNLPMSKASNFLGDMLVATKGDRLGKGGQQSALGHRGNGVRKQNSNVTITDIRFEKHQFIFEKPCMLFSFVVSGQEGHKIRLYSKAGILLDGGQVEYDSPSGSNPQVVAWYDDKQQLIDKDTDNLEFTSSGNERLYTAVSLPENIALSLKVTAEVLDI